MRRHTISDFIVDTNGHCFICSSKVTLSECNSDGLASGRSTAAPSSYSSLHALSQYLKIDISEVFHEKESIPPELLNNVKSSKLKVLLCGKCAKWNARIAALSLQLEKIETEVCFYVELIHGSLLALDDDDDKTRRPCKLDEKVRIVKSLRTETMKKCSQRLKSVKPFVKVRNLTAKQLFSKQRRIKSKFCKDIKSNVENVTDNAFDDDDMNHIIIKNEDSDTEGSDEYFDDHAEFVEDPTSQDESNDPLHITTANQSYHLQTELATETVNNVKRASVSGLKKSSSVKILPSPRSEKKIEKLTFVINPETGKFKCNICSVEFTEKGSLRRHYDGIHLKIRHECNLCGKEFAHKRDCTRHHKSTHIGVRFKCNICSVECTTRTDLQQHYDGIHLKIRHKCNLCGKEFAHKRDYSRHHKSTHIGVRFKCNFCGKCFTRKCSLITHQQSSHLGK